MLMVIRQVVAILALPCTIAVAMPVWIGRRNHIVFSRPEHWGAAVLAILGVGLLAIGLALFTSSLFYFWTRGRGTLAPWDPPRRFVIEGPYRFVRNPMISGVIFVLFAEACLLRSWPHAGWAGLFALVNAIYIPILEEPMLAARFGEAYARYRRDVRRFVPRLRAWSGS
jgi:protein-S-isoprenylcysteine O-methyltransferase Ste14